MSLWGATVITNLMSAIPWIGQDIVEFIWGGFYLLEEPYNSDVVLKILFIAGITLYLGVIYREHFSILNRKMLMVKIITTWGESAGVRDISTLEASQRLNTGNLTYAYLVGLFEADGWFSVSKKGKYLTYELGIELSIRDVQLIYKIKHLLGIGVVCFRTDKNRPETVLLRVRNKNHLINFIIPIFDKYPFISNKQYDYIRFKNALLSGIMYSEQLSEYTRPNNPLNSVEGILKLGYFPAWLVGFIEGEGCFSIYKPSKDNSLIASFDISQTDAEILVLAINKHLYLNKNIKPDKINNFKLKASSVRGVENVIKFMQNAPVKLLGHKKLQYVLWIKALRTIPRYTKKLTIPNNY